MALDATQQRLRFAVDMQFCEAAISVFSTQHEMRLVTVPLAPIGSPEFEVICRIISHTAYVPRDVVRNELSAFVSRLAEHFEAIKPR